MYLCSVLGPPIEFYLFIIHCPYFSEDFQCSIVYLIIYFLCTLLCSLSDLFISKSLLWACCLSSCRSTLCFRSAYQIYRLNVSFAILFKWTLLLNPKGNWKQQHIKATVTKSRLKLLIKTSGYLNLQVINYCQCSLIRCKKWETTAK